MAPNGTANGVEPEKVDVLIVGAGPAGLMMAEWMAKCGIKTRICDKRGTKVCIRSHALACNIFQTAVNITL